MRKVAFMMVMLGIYPLVMGCGLLEQVRGEGRAEGRANSVEPSIEAIVAGYGGWQKLTSEPRKVTAFLWSLCRIQTAAEMAELESPHAEYWVDVYVNEVGYEAMTTEVTPTFPTGTVIVKTKLRTFDAVAPGGGETRDEVGIMIKRETGYDPEAGDWEYAYWNAGQVTRGKTAELSHCRDCHRQNAAETDSVFRPYINVEPAQRGGD